MFCFWSDLYSVYRGHASFGHVFWLRLPSGLPALGRCWGPLGFPSLWRHKVTLTVRFPHPTVVNFPPGARLGFLFTPRSWRKITRWGKEIPGDFDGDEEVEDGIPAWSKAFSPSFLCLFCLEGRWPGKGGYPLDLRYLGTCLYPSGSGKLHSAPFCSFSSSFWAFIRWVRDYGL